MENVFFNKDIAEITMIVLQMRYVLQVVVRKSIVIIIILATIAVAIAIMDIVTIIDLELF